MNVRRLVVIGSLVAVPLSLTAPAAAHDEDGDHHDAEGVVTQDWTPSSDEVYVDSEPVEACGTTVIVRPGDVREAEERVIEFPDGTVRIEFRGDLTVDIVREEDGTVLLDELDVSGPGHDVISPDGAHIRQTLEGASLVFPVTPQEEELFEAVGLHTLSYFEKGFITFGFTVDPATGEILDTKIVKAKAHIVDVCDLIEEAADRHHHDGDHHDDEHDHHGEG